MVGRIEEQKQLTKLLRSGKSEFVAVYGRRRVGKTFLVKEFFKDNFVFWHTGVSPYDEDKDNLLKDELYAFHANLIRYGSKETSVPKSWLEAFNRLSRLVESISSPGKKVIFIDELPWMDTPRSRFIPAFENFWNDWAAKRDDILLIVCGSATSWIEDHLIHNKGGLYGRLTDRIHLRPFTLGECREFYQKQGVKMSDYDVALSYMVMGGIPYYMGYVDAEYSLSQNIDRLFFAEDAKLKDEFDLLFGSLFVNPNQYKFIVRLLATRHSGFSREEISRETGIANGGGLTTQLKSLIASNFVQMYTPYGEKKSANRYKLTDSFCRFWLNFLERKTITDRHFWVNNLQSGAMNAWKGIAFEELCFNHIPQIKRCLGIEGVNSIESQWVIRGDGDNIGAQLDLIIERADNVVNLCEMKFYKEPFKVTKEYDRTIARRISLLQERLPKRKIVHLTLVSYDGLEYNEYAGAFQKVITLEELF